ncbi:16S rRNA methyltransferase GidB [Enhygromyxa salina]|uniref:Ribosomal RNA small subunit methyltransferase G n=1 Tax=Enhygromyxa salina TaxID=215803 RepID=A0A2S9YEN4_9BACT|nr:RsmG family class I SAM-dependent methyltransferase [Enhygromyxa salina]PRQ03563.1 16S rRNA methyltransferase GidB [Enhygromyxa salina]
MLAVSEAVLRESCRDLGLEITTRKLDKLLIIKDFIRFYGRSMNLTGALREDSELDAHVIEALQVVALAERLKIRGRWLDVGSGGGFPALVLAAWLGDLNLVLVEPREKRASALELALAKIGRPDARVIRGRLEGSKWRPIDGAALEPGFDAASARAVFSPERWIAEVTPWMKPRGMICLHLNAGDSVPEGSELAGRVDGERWSAVGVWSVPRGTTG